MSEFQDMADRIAAEQHRLRGEREVPPSPYTVIETTVKFAAIYSLPSMGRNFFVSFPAVDLLPHRELLQVARIRQDKQSGEPLVTAVTRHAPTVVATKDSKCSLDTTLICANAANIPPNALFTGLKVQLAVSPLVYRRTVPGWRMGMRIDHNVEELQLHAIEVNVDRMVDRYDELCRQYFGKTWAEGLDV